MRRKQAAQPIEHIWRLDPKEMWRALKQEPISFWLLCLYLVFEYLHPQIIYPWMNVLPWGFATLGGAGLAFFLEGRRFHMRTPAHTLILLFLLIVLVSSVFAWQPAHSYKRLEPILTWVFVFFLVSSLVVTEKRFVLFTILFLLSSFKMSQHGARSWMLSGFGFSDWGVTGSPVWFHNSGEFGIQMCIIFPISLAFFLAVRRYWGKWKQAAFLLFPVTAIMSIIASSSRGALVGGALVLAWLVLRSRYRVRAALAGAVVVFVVMWATPPEQKDRWNAMGDDKTSVKRLDMWKDGLKIAREHPVLGIGYANWNRYYRSNYGLGGLPHNIFIEAMAELGYTGLLSFLSLIGATFYMNYRTRRLVRRLPGDNRFLWHMAHGLDGGLIGFMGSGFFVTVLYYPFFWFNLAMTAALHVSALNKVRAVRAAMAASAATTPVATPAVLPGAPLLGAGAGAR